MSKKKGGALWGWRYVGGGWLVGIPARHISQTEAQEKGWVDDLAASFAYAPSPTDPTAATERGSDAPSAEPEGE